MIVVIKIDPPPPDTPPAPTYMIDAGRKGSLELTEEEARAAVEQLRTLLGIPS